MSSSLPNMLDSISSSEIEETDDVNTSLLRKNTRRSRSSPPPPRLPPPANWQRDDRHRQGCGILSKMKLQVARAWNWLRKKFIVSTRMLSLNEKSSAVFMAFISNTAVMAIMTLNIYSASYFLTWKKDGSMCHIFPDKTGNKPGDVKINGTIQLIVIGLPFACLPLALCIGGLAEAAKGETRHLGCVAALVMIEIIYTVLLGAVMTFCMSDVSGVYVAVITVSIVVLLLLCWACCCRYPKCLRQFMCKRVCGNIDEVHVDVEDMV